MPRLPQPSGNNGNWGTILNKYLSQTHKSDGTLKDDIVTGAIIADGIITELLLNSAVQVKLNQVTPTWTTLSGKPAVLAAGSDQATARWLLGPA